MKLRPPRSLIGQFALLHLATALIAAATLPFGVAVLLHRVAHHYQRDVLRQQAEDVAQALRTRDPGQAIAAVDILAGGLTLTIVDAHRRILAERGPARPRMIALVPLTDRPRITRRGTLAAISRPAAGRGRWVVVSQDDMAPEVVTDDIVRIFLKRFALLLVPLALLVPLVGVWMTRRLTRRMTAVAAIAAEIGPRTLDRRLPRGTLPAEVEPLAAATNAALDRLEGTFAAQAAFAADVAHELRTPLSVVRLRADAVADADQRAALLAGVDRVARVVAQLLALADLERPLDGAAPVDLAGLAAAVVADRAPAVLAGGRAIQLEDRGAAACAGHEAAIVLALENLVDNAARYTPQGTRIVVTAGPGARLAVSDDGPPIDPAKLAVMADRFWRAAEAPAGGSGLGLSIVARVAAAHGGALRLQAGAGGRGLEAVVILGEG